jgi:hypothetical protein
LGKIFYKQLHTTLLHNRIWRCASLGVVDKKGLAGPDKGGRKTALSGPALRIKVVGAL